MDESILGSSIRYLKGVGEAREKLFNKLGIYTLRDLAGYFPRRYEDRTNFKLIDQLTVGESVCVRAVVIDTPVLTHVRRGLSHVKFRITDDSAVMTITFFNAPYVKDTIKRGISYVFYGKISGSLLWREMVNPLFEQATDIMPDTAPPAASSAGPLTAPPAASSAGPLTAPPAASSAGPLTAPPASPVDTRAAASTAAVSSTGCIVPIYRLTAKLTQKAVAVAVHNALDKCAETLPDVLPAGIATEYKLCKTRYAYYNIHFPEGFRELETARYRLIFEELFVLITAMQLMRGRRGVQAGRVIKSPDLGEFYNSLPYKPTNAQIRAINDAVADMTSGKMMNRLIQGDVGSGKTLAAAACAYAVWSSGGQTAFMAPTEILAKQHHATLLNMLEPHGINVGLLTGSIGAKGKREIYQRLKEGSIDIIAGTHALISEGVEFKNLALVITDEQHRFGVAQRAALASKGECPHVLVMSATPIPRTLALIIYGDLSVSVIDEMPPGRTEIETYVVGESYRTRINNFVRRLVSEGRQVYIICPAVEETEDPADGEQAAIKSVIKYHAKLSTQVFNDLSVELVHGKMPAKAKDAAMEAFVSGSADILVATTVVEVGVDVSNAALIIVENADRYGLSQLHQLRGRVGRGKHKSYCVLFTTPKESPATAAGNTATAACNTATAACNTATAAGNTATAAGADEKDDISQRLLIMKSTNDGFKIAEEDLKLRGPGDFFGSRQHGLPELKIADFAADMAVLREAQQAAADILKKDPDLQLPEHRPLAGEITRMFSGTLNT